MPEQVPYGSAYGLDNLAAQSALEASAIIVLDEAMEALGYLHHHHEVKGLSEGHADATASQVFARLASRQDIDPVMVSSDLPQIYKARYATFDFLKNWVVTVGIVGWKLAQLKPCPLTNVAEELAMHVLIKNALLRFEEQGSEDPEAEEQLGDLYESAFEDNDFKLLYRLDDSDDLPDLDPAGQLGLTDLRFKNWFLPFGSGVGRGIPHPFLSDK
jgi:hypothetical protein